MENDNKTIKKIPTQRTRAKVDVSTFNEANKTIEVTFATETVVRAYDWDFGPFNEILSLAPEHVDLTRLKSGAPVLDNHRTYGSTREAVVGVVEDAWLDGLVGRARIRFSNSKDDQDLMEKVKDGIVTGISVGYDVLTYEITRHEDSIPTCRAISWVPTEISFVPVQADINSRTRSKNEESHDVSIIESIKAPEKENEVIIEIKTEELNTNTNINNNEMTEEEKLAEQNKVRSAAAKAERERISGIQKHTRALNLPETFAQTLIEDETVTDLAIAGQRALEEWEKGQALNPRQNAEQQKTDKERTRSAMADALTLRITPKASEVMGEERVRAASDFKGQSLLRFAEEALIRSGVRTAGYTSREIATLALGGRVRGMHHTTDFPLLLMDTVQRTLLSQYAIQERTFQVWSRRTTLKDFRPISRVRLSEILGDLEKVREGEEYKYATFTESGETYQLAKYGKIVAITWEAIVNDDLSAFDRIPQAFAVKSANLQTDLVYKTILANGFATMSDGNALFSAAHKNYKGTANNQTTGGTELTEANMAEAYTTFRTQTGADGSKLNLKPKYLVVGPKNEFRAKKLTSVNFQATKQSDTPIGALTGLEVVVDAEIENYEWFLIADPNQIDTTEYAFLDGEEELFIEQREGFNIDGIEVKARTVFAAKAIDWRGFYRNNGAVLT